MGCVDCACCLQPSTPSNGQPGSHPSASGGATESLPQGAAPKRKHPVLLLSGIATNAMGFDISPEASAAPWEALH